MIKYELKCRKDHVFEGWFQDSATYDSQAAAGKIACPVCNSRKTSKAPMAHSIGRSKSAQAADEVKQKAVMMTALRELSDHVEKSADYAGDQLADKAGVRKGVG